MKIRTLPRQRTRFLSSFGMTGKTRTVPVFLLLLAGCLPPPAGHSWYYVQRGDTLWSIARRHDADFFSLVNANKIQDPSRIYPGMKLKVPSAQTAAAPASSPSAAQAPRTRARPARPTRPSDISFAWPVKGKVLEHFGKSNLTRSLGIVIKADSPQVRAAAPGKVSFRGEAGNFGNTVIIEHGGGYHSVYAYLDSISVRHDESVSRGAMLGSCGSRKKYGEQVLYFEIRFGTEAYDPMMYLN